MKENLNLMLLGANTMALFTASVFFLRFWRTTRDRFFLFFAVSFSLEGMVRLMLGLSVYSDEDRPLIYLLRLLAFMIIIFAIVDKNLVASGTSRREGS